MEYKFSQQLRDRAKAFFTRRMGREVSDEEVESYLESFSRLTDFFMSK
jgi:hypothetical protein